jgi:hypothetical protein
VPVQRVDATPSGIKQFLKVVFMKQGRRFGFSAEQKLDVWRRWKAGQTLHEIGRAFGKEHSSIRCLVSRHGGIAPAVRRRALLALTLRAREEISRGLASGSSTRETILPHSSRHKRLATTLRIPVKGEFRARYLGVTGWEITDGKALILIDPYLSRPARAPTPSGPGGGMWLQTSLLALSGGLNLQQSAANSLNPVESALAKKGWREVQILN